jgi:hypothetical protein
MCTCNARGKGAFEKKSQALNINDPHWLKQLMMKATSFDFIAFHKMNLKECEESYNKSCQ